MTLIGILTRLELEKSEAKEHVLSCDGSLKGLDVSVVGPE
jgi:hypothetical protein